MAKASVDAFLQELRRVRDGVRSLWLKLPSRLKILVKNGTSVLSIHLDQVSARSVGWPPVYFFLLNCPVTCCLDPFFHLHKFFHLLPLFYIIGPACHCGRSRLSLPLPSPHLSLSILQARLVIVAGPAYLLPLPSPHLSLSLLQARLVIVAGPAYFLFSLSYRPGLSLWQVPPIPSFDLLYISPSLPLL